MYQTISRRKSNIYSRKNGCEIEKEVIRSAGLIMEEIQMKCIWTNPQNIGLAGHWRIINGIQQTVYEDIQSSNDRRSSKMYSVYHEMDIMKFVEAINEKWDQYYTETNLKRLRKIAGLSQRELADLSGVALRQIQLFEQKRNINHTRAIDVLKIGKVLGCKSEDLLEI